MKKLFKLGVIGCGFMSKSIIEGVLNTGLLKPRQIIATDINFDNMEHMKKLGITTTIDNKYLVDNAKFILFAVKPQNIIDLLKELKDLDVEFAITILAGVKKKIFKHFIPNIQIARCMPNMPCSIGHGVTAIDIEDFNADDGKFLLNLFEATGKVIEINEDKMDAVTSISGSGPAYVYYFIDSMIKGGIEQGLTEEESKSLTLSTIIGAAKVIEKTKDKSIEELIESVCSKGGTTIEAMNIFRSSDFQTVTKNAIKSCKKRAEELSNL